jgi:hypothetical protein
MQVRTQIHAIYYFRKTIYPPDQGLLSEAKEGLYGQGLGPAGEGFNCKWNSPATIA